MPKILECTRETMLEIAKKSFLEHGYEAFTIRDVAKECGVSVGTIYSHFPSKEALMTQAVVEEWRGMLSEIKARLPGIGAASDAMKYLYESIFSFNQKFHGYCTRTRQSEKEKQESEARLQIQLQQVTQLVEIIAPQTAASPGLSTFIADALLSSCVRGVFPYEKIAPFIEKLSKD